METLLNNAFNPLKTSPECTRAGVYSTGQKKGFSYVVGNLVATNWPIEKALYAIGCNQIQTK